jgi:glycosyltransferase involved in cell wall biosynthesis
MHDILSPEHFGPLQRLLVTRLANLTARRVIVVSEAARKSFVESGGDANRAVVVFDGVDTKLFSAPKPAACTQLRRQLGVENVPLIGLVGRIAPWKGQHVMLAALRDLPGVHLLVVGDALFGEEDFLQQLRELAASYGIADRVHWLGQRDDVPALMRIADIVVHTSTSAEPFGRVIVEAMLAERPVLAADHGAARELLGDDPRALVPPGNAGRLAAAIRTILALPEDKRAAIGSRNRSRAEAIFTLGAMLAGIDQVVALDN